MTNPVMIITVLSIGLIASVALNVVQLITSLYLARRLEGATPAETARDLARMIEPSAFNQIWYTLKQAVEMDGRQDWRDLAMDVGELTVEPLLREVEADEADELNEAA